MPRKGRLSHMAFPSNLHLQLLFGLANVLPGLLEPLIHFRNFLLDLSVAFGSVYSQKEMVPILEGFLLGWECDDLVPDLIALQLVPADLIVHDCHIKSISGKFLPWSPQYYAGD